MQPVPLTKYQGIFAKEQGQDVECLRKPAFVPAELCLRTK